MDLGEKVETGDGSYSIIHPEFGECYHSSSGAAKEARDLYVLKSGFAEHIRNASKAVRVLDVGLGLAYNALSTIESWLAEIQRPPLQMVSLEINQSLVESLVTGAPSWSEGWPQSWMRLIGALRKVEAATELEDFEQRFPFATSFWICELDADLDWVIVVGDARKALQFKRKTERPWHFVWQDPFSPEKNPCMWSEKWFSRLKAECDFNTKLMTYSVSRQTKNALSAAGWYYEKLKTTTRKRHWISASPQP